MSMDDLHELSTIYLIPFGLRILVALAVFVVGRWIAKFILATFNRVMDRSQVDVSLRKFLAASSLNNSSENKRSILVQRTNSPLALRMPTFLAII